MKKFEKIDKYVNGEMSPEEHLLFEEEMAKNETLAAAVKIYREIETEMRQNKKYDDDEILLRKKLAELNGRYFNTNDVQPGSYPAEMNSDDSLNSDELQFFEQTKVHTAVRHVKVRRINVIRLAMAATIAGIIAFGITYFIEKNNTSPVSISSNKNDKLNRGLSNDTSSLHTKDPANNRAKQNVQEGKDDKDTIGEKPVTVNTATLYADNFIPDTAPADKEGPLGDAFAYYENRKYVETVAAINAADLTGVITRGEESDQKLNVFYAGYYTGLSYMAGKDFLKAIPALENAISLSPEGLFLIKAQWYLSLAYVKRGQLKSAEELLKKIVLNKPPSAYKIKAQKLLLALKEIK